MKVGAKGRGRILGPSAYLSLELVQKNRDSVSICSVARRCHDSRESRWEMPCGDLHTQSVCPHELEGKPSMYGTNIRLDFWFFGCCFFGSSEMSCF